MGGKGAEGMEYWKEHASLRMVLIAVLFAAGIAAVIGGWRLTGRLAGLGIMIAGVGLLVAALWIYNKPFEKPRKKKT